MSGALQAVFQNQRSFFVPPDTIGQAFGGGFYAGKISTSGDGVATHYLIVAPRSSGAASSQQWRTSVPSGNPSNRIDGPGNSETMNSGTFPAAQWCRALNIGGYTDWYLPAIDELEVCYYFLKPTTGSNSQSYGSNAFAVSPEPRNTNYSTGSPGQTSVSAFQSGGSEAFDGNYEYWSSTQSDSNNALDIYFANGHQYGVYKTTADIYHLTRAVRRIPI